MARHTGTRIGCRWWGTEDAVRVCACGLYVHFSCRLCILWYMESICERYLHKRCRWITGARDASQSMKYHKVAETNTQYKAEREEIPPFIRREEKRREKEEEEGELRSGCEFVSKDHFFRFSFTFSTSELREREAVDGDERKGQAKDTAAWWMQLRERKNCNSINRYNLTGNMWRAGQRRWRLHQQ